MPSSLAGLGRRALAPAALTALTALATVLPAAHAAPASRQTFCFYDPIGTSGPGYAMARDYVVAMQRHGADLQLKSYVDERVAVEDFRTGQCDAVAATGLRTRPYNPFTAALDSIGASTVVRDGRVDMAASYQVVQRAVETFASPAAAKLMVSGAYEIGGVFPLGAVYAMVNDRRISSPEAASGKRVAAFDHDKAQAEIIKRLGAQPVSADITNFHTKFNNGSIDIVVAPAIAYKPLELYRGIGSKGGVSRFPMMILSYQLVLRRDRFPAGFGEKSREYWLAHQDEARRVITTAEADIPAAQWIDFSADDARRYALMMREARIELADKGLYDKRGLKMLKKIRCSLHAADAECGTDSENW
jgi:hypothetical protein